MHAGMIGRTWLTNFKTLTKTGRSTERTIARKAQEQCQGRAFIRRYYGSRRRKIIPRPRIYYNNGRIRLSASPDMAIEEDGKVKLVKLGITKKGDKPEIVRILLRILYQAAATRFDIDPHDVIYFDVVNSARVHGTGEDANLAVIIDNACEAMASML